MLELVILAVAAVVVAVVLHRGSKERPDSVEDKSSPHRGGDNNIKNREE